MPLWDCALLCRQADGGSYSSVACEYERAQPCCSLARGEPVSLRSFGLFSARAKKERVGRDFATGAEAPIAARLVVTFSPSPVLIAKMILKAEPV